MTAIGGFFELELGAGGAAYHSGAVALASGRACLRRILESQRPRRLRLPFYICDSVLTAGASAGVEVDFYALDETLEPCLPAAGVDDDERVLYVNYFGVKGATAQAFAERLGHRAIIDDTHAFFQKGYAGACSFNSARKFFGVPDGAYAYGRGLAAAPLREPARLRYDYLVDRLLGRQRQAYDEYRDSEASVDDEPVAMSRLATLLLANVDYAAVRRARDRNFRRLHDRLGHRNRLAVSAEAASLAPYCYPLLTDARVPWHRLWAEEVFAPRLWPEIETRSAGERFEWERHVAAHLLPLPVDHRYGDAEMDRVSRVVAEVFGW